MAERKATDDWTRPEDPGIYILDIILLGWERRRSIAFGTVAATLLGLIYCFVAEPEYYSEGTIMVKESRKPGGVPAVLTQLGGLGGLMAAELGGAGITLGRLELVAKSRELTEDVVVKYDLLPVIFDEDWDAGKKTWKAGKKVPSVRKGVEAVRKGMLRVVADPKQGTLRVGIAYKDSGWVKRIADQYLEALNTRLRDNVIAETQANQEFLTQQLDKAMDPLIREKVQNLIAMEIERSMLASNRSFDIIEKPVVPIQKTKPKKKLVLILSMVGGFLLSFVGTMVWRFIALVREKNRVRKPAPVTAAAGVP
jgi:uncharacterized protein involved in exopolysaccharide biosynthesis